VTSNGSAVRSIIVFAARDLCLAHRRRRLDIQNHRRLQIDEVIVGIGITRDGVGRSGIAGRRIGRRDRLRLDRRRSAEGRVIQDRQIFRDGTTGGRIEVFDFGNASTSMRIGHDYAGVDGEGLTSHDPFLHAARQHGLEQLSQKIALAEAAVAVLGKCRMIRNLAVETQATEME
jgi:hypothetical protein